MDPFSSRVLLEFEDVFRDEEEEEEEEEDEDDVVFFELRVDLLEEAFLFILSSSSLWLFSGCVFACRRRVSGFYRSGKWRGKNRVFRFFASSPANKAKHHLLPTITFNHSLSKAISLSDVRFCCEDLNHRRDLYDQGHSLQPSVVSLPRAARQQLQHERLTPPRHEHQRGPLPSRRPLQCSVRPSTHHIQPLVARPFH